MIDYAPGMRIIARGEEWIVKRVETNSLGNQTLQVVGISNLVKDYESRFMTDIESFRWDCERVILLQDLIKPGSHRIPIMK